MNNPSSMTISQSEQKVLFAGFEESEKYYLDLKSRLPNGIGALALSESELIRRSADQKLQTLSFVVLGSEIKKPIQVCQLVSRLSDQTRILVIRTENDFSAISKQIRMYPGIVRDVRVVLAGEPDILIAHLLKSIHDRSKSLHNKKRLSYAQKQASGYEYKHLKEEHYFHSLLDMLPVGIIFLDELSSVKSINPFARTILNIEYSRKINKHLKEFFPEELCQIVNDIVSQSLEQQDIVSYPVKMYSHNQVKHYLITCSPIKKHNHKSEFIVIFQDVTDYTQSQQELRKSRQDFNQVVKSIQDLFWVFSSDYKEIHYLSPAFSKIWGRKEEYFIRNPGRLLATVVPEDRERLKHYLLNNHLNDDIEFRIIRPDGGIRWILTRKSRMNLGINTAEKAAGVAHDITDQKKSEQTIKQLSTVDTLTGLLNRSGFIERLDKELETLGRSKDVIALLYLDLDDFKMVNDSLGHSIGNQLLVALTQRISRLLHSEDLIGRIGGDEFVIMIRASTFHSISSFASNVLNECAKTFELENYPINVSGSIGIAIADIDVEDASMLVQHADTAMYRSKQIGRNNFVYFNQEMNLAALERLELELRLRHAIEDSQFEMHYQPIVNSKTGKLVSMEALFRVLDHDLTKFGIENVIKLAEETNLIISLGEKCFEQICRQLVYWRHEGLLDKMGTVSVNISSKQFYHKDLSHYFVSQLAVHSLPIELVDIELTESTIMQNEDEEYTNLISLQEKGFKISIDDFGTGFSSFSRLKKLPIHKLKIDKSFVDGISDNANDLAICKGIIKLAHEIGLQVIAEGVETQRQLELLDAMNCDLIQGYFFSKPLDRVEMTDYLRHTLD